MLVRVRVLVHVRVRVCVLVRVCVHVHVCVRARERVRVRAPALVGFVILPRLAICSRPPAHARARCADIPSLTDTLT